MKKPLLQTETRVWRTYRGGHLLEEFLGKAGPTDSFYPEDWISSFVEAKNKNYVKGEGISRVLVNGNEMPITDAVSESDFGVGRRESGVLVKLLNASERLGVQVHPTPVFSRKYFGVGYGKTECWHILAAESGAAVYIGFKEGITREKWEAFFKSQNVEGMLDALHRFEVKKGDTVLVRAGTPHAIGAGCFLLEIQEPTDYTMRVEKTTVAGDELTPVQIHYGLGEEALLECFIYEGLTQEKAKEKYFISHKSESTEAREILVSYEDTPCFALDLLKKGGEIYPDSFVTLVITDSGKIRVGENVMDVCRGNKIFVPYGCGVIMSESTEAIVCYPPKIKKSE